MNPIKNFEDVLWKVTNLANKEEALVKLFKYVGKVASDSKASDSEKIITIEKKMIDILSAIEKEKVDMKNEEEVVEEVEVSVSPKKEKKLEVDLDLYI